MLCHARFIVLTCFVCSLYPFSQCTISDSNFLSHTAQFSTGRKVWNQICSLQNCVRFKTDHDQSLLQTVSVLCSDRIPFSPTLPSARHAGRACHCASAWPASNRGSSRVAAPRRGGDGHPGCVQGGCEHAWSEALVQSGVACDPSCYGLV